MIKYSCLKLNVLPKYLMNLECNVAWYLKKYFKIYLVINYHKSYTGLLLCPGQIHAVILLNSDF